MLKKRQNKHCPKRYYSKVYLQQHVFVTFKTISLNLNIKYKQTNKVRQNEVKQSGFIVVVVVVIPLVLTILVVTFQIKPEDS